MQSKFKVRGQTLAFCFELFTYIRAWCNGSIRVSKTFDLGSNPSARAKIDEEKNQKYSIFGFLFSLHQNYNMSKFGSYVQEAYDELVHKVSWPSWGELQQTTAIVIVSLILVTLVILGMDAASEQVMKFIYGMAGK